MNFGVANALPDFRFILAGDELVTSPLGPKFPSDAVLCDILGRMSSTSCDVRISYQGLNNQLDFLEK